MEVRIERGAWLKSINKNTSAKMTDFALDLVLSNESFKRAWDWRSRIGICLSIRYLHSLLSTHQVSECSAARL